jgi:hypothetical protein
VKDGAHSAKDKVSGGSRGEQSWAPAAPAAPARTVATVEEPALSVQETAVQDLPVVEPLRPSYSAPSTAAPAGPLVRPEYVAVGAAAALIAWWLVRRRR